MTKQEAWQAMLNALQSTSPELPRLSENPPMFILDLVKRPQRVIPPPPQLPVPPPVQYVDVFGARVPPPPPPPPMRVERVPSPPSRFWCFFGVHKYEIKDETTWKQLGHGGQILSQGPMYILRCPICGKMKADRLAYNQ